MSTSNVHRVDQFLQLDPEKPPIRLSTKVERQWFDEKTKHLVDRAIEQVHIALKKAGMDASEIQNVVMVGGSTGIPAIQNAVQRVFKPEIVSHGLNPMLCVAQGAAILAESIGEGRELEVVQCCTSKPRGIELSDGAFDAILAAQTYYPMESPEWRRYKTTGRAQRQLRIAVYEGEKRVARDNEWQGDVMIDFNDGLPENTPVRVGVRLDNSGTTLLSVEVEGFPNAVKEAKVERIDRKPDASEKEEQKSEKLPNHAALGPHSRERLSRRMRRGFSGTSQRASVSSWTGSERSIGRLRWATPTSPRTWSRASSKTTSRGRFTPITWPG